MRVLILSQYYDPEPIPKPGELARELRRRGHGVSVVTGFPNYPTGRIYAGFRLRAFKRETQDGIQIVRTFEFPDHGKRPLRRAMNYLSFMLSAALGHHLAADCDAIYVWHPPLTVGIAAWIAGRWRGVPVLYDVQDIWPESIVLSGLLPEGRLVRILAALERFVYARMTHILVVTEGARQNLLEKGVEGKRVTVLPNWIDDAAFAVVNRDTAAAVRSSYGWNGEFVVLFAGNLGLVQGLDVVLQAARELAPEGGFRWVFAGEGADQERLMARAHDLGLEKEVSFIGRQPAEKMPALMAAADALLVHLKRSPLSRLIVPTKTLAYLAASRPIIMAMEGAAADVVNEAGAGIAVPPEEPDVLAGVVRRLSRMSVAERDEMGRRGRRFARERYSLDRVINQYEEILSCLIRNASLG